MWWLFRHLRFALFTSVMELVTANDQCGTEVNIQGMALKRSVFKRWSVAAPHLCDVKCGQEIRCQSYNYNRKYQICELNNRTKETRPVNFLSAPGWFYIRRLDGRAPLGSIPELPAMSCQEIKASEGKHTISGKYWLDPTEKGKAQLIYCDMVNEGMDECISNISDCDVNAKCTNTYGSYNCTCKVGYTGDGHSCSDIDECKGNNSCHVNASCANNIGSHLCECYPGYTGNGQNCTDVDECGNGSHACDMKANCTNTKGSYNCTCKEGYSGDGWSCQDIDECSNGDHLCDVNANCTNTDGSHNCTCREEYIGDGQSCQDRKGKRCGPVGVADNNAIPDARITASSIYNHNYASYLGRLNETRRQGGWCPETTGDRTDYLQVDMGSVLSLCAVATQGGEGSLEWTTNYTLCLSIDGLTWNPYEETNKTKVFQGNSDQTSIVKHSLRTDFKARYVRFYPVSYHNWPCLRVEIYVFK